MADTPENHPNAPGWTPLLDDPSESTVPATAAPASVSDGSAVSDAATPDAPASPDAGRTQEG